VRSTALSGPFGTPTRNPRLARGFLFLGGYRPALSDGNSGCVAGRSAGPADPSSGLAFPGPGH